MTGTGNAERLSAAEAIAREAGALARRYFRAHDLATALKGPQDLVTAADIEIDRLITDRVKAQFPGDGVLSEEGGGAFEDNLWIVDPIDGTANFARGLPHFAISIGYLQANRIEVGVVYAPVLDQMFCARRGHGAACNGQPMRVRATTEATDALIDAGYTLRRPLEDYLALVGRLLGEGFGFCQQGSAALGLAYTADGRIDGFCEAHLKPWDVAAGMLLVEEAGGFVSDFLAGDGIRDGNALLACVPALAPALCRITGIR